MATVRASPMTTLGASWILRVGCTPVLSIDRAFDFVRELHTREPALAVEMTHLVSSEQLERLLAGDLDLAIVVEPDEHPDLVFEPLYAGDVLVVCLAADHPLAGREVVRPADLRAETLVTLDGSLHPTAYGRALARFAAAGYEFQRVEEREGADFRNLLLAAGSRRGVAFVPETLEELNEAGDNVVVRPLDPVLRMPPTSLGWRATATPGLLPILETVRSVAHDLVAASEGGGSAQEGSTAGVQAARSPSRREAKTSTPPTAPAIESAV
jgi:DNA-binding transcriptional LysR family regulator